MKTDAFINVNITLNGKDDSVDLLNYADWDELKVDLKHLFNVKNVDGIEGVITKTSFGDMGGSVTLENAMNFWSMRMIIMIRTLSTHCFMQHLIISFAGAAMT